MLQVQLPFPGSKYFLVGSVLIFILGIAELIAGAVVIADSSGYYIGGVYVGIMAMLSAPRGMRLASRSSVGIYSILLVLLIIVCIIGAALQAGSYNFLKNLAACSSYSSSLQTSCGKSAYYTCTGDSDYYLYAYSCEVTYVYSDGIEDDQCSCINSDDLSTCYSYTNIKDCGKLIRDTPGALQAAYALSIVCLLISAFLFVLSLLAYYTPERLGGKKWEDVPAIDTNNVVVVVPATTISPIITQGYIVEPAK